MHRIVRAITAGVAVLATGLAMPAASAGTHPNSPTPACTAVSPSCHTPVVAISPLSAQDFIPTSDFAMQYQGPNPLVGFNGGRVGTNEDNSLQNGTEDFTWARVATVPPPSSHSPGAFGFTGFDRHNYGLDGVYVDEYTPFGFDSGFCIQVTRLRNVVLRPCRSSLRQAFIISTTAPLMNPATNGYVFALLVRQALDAQHHLLLTDPNPGGDTAQLVARRGHSAGPGLPSRQMWNAIP